MLRYKAFLAYPEIIQREGMMLQRGMNFRVRPTYSIILMSARRGAPYNDCWHADTGLLEYEGHDQPRRQGLVPKAADQLLRNKTGTLTENGKFFEAVAAYKRGGAQTQSPYRSMRR